MHDHEHKERRSPDLLAQMPYETEDLDAGKFAKGAFWMFVFLIACSAVVFVVIQFWFPARPAPEATIQRRIPDAPVPLLQSNITKITDMMSLRQKETAVLEHPAVLDAENGVYRIPVDQAIEILAERGLPASASASGQAPPVGGLDE